jgi:hypothetical protein
MVDRFLGWQNYQALPGKEDRTIDFIHENLTVAILNQQN